MEIKGIRQYTKKKVLKLFINEQDGRDLQYCNMFQTLFSNSMFNHLIA